MPLSGRRITTTTSRWSGRTHKPSLGFLSSEMLLDNCNNASIMSSQSPSNSNNGNNGVRSFVEPYGNRVLSLNEVDTLRRMTMQNSQQQQQQEQNRGGAQPQSSSQLPTNPFLVLTQVPVQATPFANFASNNPQQGINHNQSCMTQNNGRQQPQQLQPQGPTSSSSLSAGNNFMPDDDSWAQMLQPTPLAPNHFHNGGGMPQQQQRLQHGMAQPQQSPHQQQQQQQQQQQRPGNNNSNTSFDPSTMTFLQELMMNAATAALQQQQQQQMMQQNNNGNNTMMNDSSSTGSHSQGGSVAANNNKNFQNMSPQQQQLMMQSMTQALAGRIPVDTSVSPVPRPDHNNSSNNGTVGVQAWKQMWDSASKTMFQQQYQQLLQQTGQQQQPQVASSHNNNNVLHNSASFPVQPSKRKYADFAKNNNNNSNSVSTISESLPEAKSPMYPKSHSFSTHHVCLSFLAFSSQTQITMLWYPALTQLIKTMMTTTATSFWILIRLHLRKFVNGNECAKCLTHHNNSNR